MDQNLMCTLHKKPILLVSDKEANLQFFCVSCIQQKYQLTQINTLLEFQKKIRSRNNIKILNLFLKKLQENEFKTEDNINSLCSYVSQQVQSIQERKIAFKALSQNFSQNQKTDLAKNLMDFQVQIQEIKTQISSQLSALPIAFQQEEIEAFESNLIYINQNFLIDFTIPATQINFLRVGELKQTELCNALAFNRDLSLLVAGCNAIIRVFKFQPILLQVQCLKAHTKDITVLVFMFKSNQFISGSEDSLIIIWKQNENSKVWETFQVLNRHTQKIIYIQLNRIENQFVSGSLDNSIKIWQFQDCWQEKQIINIEDQILSICYNQQDSMIASTKNKKIFVFQKGEQWIETQQISIIGEAYNLFFINQKLFIFQPYQYSYIQIYDQDEKSQKYLIGKQVKLEFKQINENNFIPIRYLSHKKLLFVQFGKCIYIINVKRNSEHIIQQSIYFGTYSVSACISFYGKGFVTWDDQSKEFQVRKIFE